MQVQGGKYLAGLGGGTSWVGLLFTGRLILASKAPLHFPTTPSLPKASLKCEFFEIIGIYIYIHTGVLLLYMWYHRIPVPMVP